MTQGKRIVFTALTFLIISISSFAQDILQILPLGNSLTYGYYDGTYITGDKVSYRLQLYNLLVSAGYNFDFIGHTSSGFNYIPNDYSQNGGISGIRDDQMADVLNTGYYYKPSIGEDVYIIYPPQPYLNVYEPDLILLHLGTNDIQYDDIYDLSEVNEILDAVDDYETSHDKDVLVIITKIISTKDGSGSCTADWKITQYNNALSTLVNSRISAGDKLKLIDMQCGAGINYNTEMINELHPTQAGYDKMGTYWFEAIDEIHDAPVISPITVSPILEGQSFSTVNLNSYITDDYTPDANITWELVSAPEHLDVTINTAHILSVVPIDSEWTGNETITLRAWDNGRYIEQLKKSATTQIDYTIESVNDTPVIISQITSFTPLEDYTFTLHLSDLEVEDPDNLWSELTLNILPGDHYEVLGSTIKPEKDYDGTMYITVTVSDLEDESEPFLVQAYFSPVNDAPEIIDSEDTTINEWEEFELTLDLLTIYDPDNTVEELTLSVLGGNNYSVVDHNTIRPKSEFEGMLYVNVYVMDLELPSELYQVPVRVQFYNQPPEFTNILNDTIICVNIQFTFDVETFDANGDKVDLEAITLPDFLSFVKSTGTIIGTPNMSDLGEHEISIDASDGKEISTMNSTITVSTCHAIDIPELSSHTRLYPNPVSSILTIVPEEPVIFKKLTVLDLLGRVAIEERPIDSVNSEISLSVSDLADGTYILLLYSDTEISYKKFVVYHSP